MSNAGAGDEPQEVVDRLEHEVAGLRRSRRRLAEAGYADRRAIERDLHDGVQQHLVALAVDLQRLSAQLDGDRDAAKAVLGEFRANLQEALEAATELARTIQPPMLDGRGLNSAIRAAAERAGVTVVIDGPASAGYAPEVIAALYWFCVDAMSAGSAGSAATVRMRDEDGGLAVEISVADHLADDRVERLRDRIEALDGRVSVAELQGGGSRVQAWLPSSR